MWRLVRSEGHEHEQNLRIHLHEREKAVAAVDLRDERFREVVGSVRNAAHCAEGGDTDAALHDYLRQ